MPNQGKEKTKIYVLDTSVCISDPYSIKKFKEHDVVIPITVFEEMDRLKNGGEEKNLAAREFIRLIKEIGSRYDTLTNWVNINGQSHGRFKVETVFPKGTDANMIFRSAKPDHDILNTAIRVKEEEQRPVIVVTKDANLQIKAKSLKGLQAEDYQADRILNLDTSYTGVTMHEVSDEIISKFYEDSGMCSPDLFLPKKQKIFPNQYFILRSKSSKSSEVTITYYNAKEKSLVLVENMSACKVVKPKSGNLEQICALHALLNKDVRVLTLQGQAGTGKTLLSLAAAIDQFDKEVFQRIFLARPIIHLSGKDRIGFLPGDLNQKIGEFNEPFWDNLQVIQGLCKSEGGFKKIIDELRENKDKEGAKLSILPLQYIRGRSFVNSFVFVDEAQNLDRHEIKTIISRMGEGSKLVFTGDIHQIDSPYLDLETNGFSRVVTKFKGLNWYAHVKLSHGERSEVADAASELL